jgi:hypothetical protein|tara:strand:- start:3395 stop:4003 length:609 start_codon:yes stop_codon:yes gene_type:complete
MKSDDQKKKRGRPRKHPEKVDHGVSVKRPVNDGPPLNPQSVSHIKEEPTGWDGRFKSVEPRKTQKKARKGNYKWNHPATINWIMGQADPVGFLAAVMSGKEIFPVYAKDNEGLASEAGKISADPELRVMAAKTLLAKCIPDLKAVEITAQIEERKVLDISRLKDDDLSTIERVLEHAVIDAGESGEDEEISEGVYQELLANN